ncbi:type VI secretion protein IcmF/TssM N-terminal domain-containing protein [Francisella philomiragia]|uniref:type VI secretion protein IcmF/TssM N-terminal domain-containing protein n=1 Tax=Francisella philomiragia TaxID=28110 RepID=UPI001C9DA50D|nr:type VI secretion protein IcmF/TssM N-terminal domain-containing protein [Francisella philomiragia]MBY7735067.1 hypothetical protein [Francisella philomiragia]
MKRNLVSKTIISHISALIIIWILLPFFKLSSYDLFASEVVKLFLTCIYFITFYVIKAHKDYKINFNSADQEYNGYLSKFSEALRELIYLQTKNIRFFRGRGLYRSPWFLTLGLSDSGKTTIVKNCNIHFNSKYSETSAKSNKPTFDWYSSPDVTFIDINSKLTEVNRVEEASLFDNVIDLIKRNRRLKPLDGLILNINAERLITETPNELERDFNKYKIILKKIYNSGIRNIPIYVFLTNMDKVPGFVEYFDPKSFDVTNNILGVTLPSSNVSEPLDWLDDQFNNIINNINENVFSSIRKKNSNIDNDRAFYFVRYFSYLCEKLNSVLADAIYENNYTKSLYLRGVYFTAVSTNKIHHFDKARSDVYFLKNIMKDVILKEGRKATFIDNTVHFLSKHKNYVYSASGVTVVGLVLSWITGYTQASYYLAEVKHTNNTLQPIIGAPLYSPSYWERMQKLAYLAKLKNTKFASWHHFGFSFPTSTDKVLNEQYNIELKEVFRPYVLQEIKSNIQSLISNIANIGDNETVDKAQKMQTLYDWLMMYVMFDKTQHMDTKFIKDNLDSYWKNLYSNDSATLNSLEVYLDDLLLLPTDSLHSKLDNSLIEKAKNVLGGDIYVYRAYEQFKQKNIEQKANYRPVIIGGLQYVNLFEKPISINYIYTIDGWQNYSKESLVKELEIAEKDQWVFDSIDQKTKFDATKAKSKIFDLYWNDYATVWVYALKNIKFRKTNFQQKYNDSRNNSYISVFDQIFTQLKTNLTSDVVSSTNGNDKKMISSLANFVNNRYRVDQLNEKISLLEKLVMIMSGNSNTNQEQAFVVSELIATNKQDSLIGLKEMVKELPTSMTFLVDSYLSSFTYSMFDAGAIYDTDLWNNKLSQFCSSNLASNYPFANSKDELGLSEYKELMSKSSDLMNYINNNVLPFAIKDKSGLLTIKEINGVKFPFDKHLFKQINVISQLNALTKNNNNNSAEDKLNMTVGLTPVLLSNDLSGIDIIYDNKKYGYFNGPQYQQDFYWPATNNDTNGTVQIIWHYKNKEDVKNVYTGPWGLINFLSHFEYNQKDDTYTIKFNKSFATYQISTKGKGSINSLGSLENLQCKF